MPFTVTKRIAGRLYAYEYASFYDRKSRRSRQRMVRYLGPCDRHGRVTRSPKVRLEGVHSAFPVGPLAVFYAAARQLRLLERI